MRPDEAEALAECYLAPEVAEALLLRATDTTAPELQRRALQALRWLDPDDDDPVIRFGHGGVGDVLARSLVTLAHGLVYHADRATRQRCAQLVAAVLNEAAKLEPRACGERCA